jgi:hypothetical protein
MAQSHFSFSFDVSLYYIQSISYKKAYIFTIVNNLFSDLNVSMLQYEI